MAKNIVHGKANSSFSIDKSIIIASSLAILLFCTLWYLSDSSFSALLSNPTTITKSLIANLKPLNRSHDPPEPTFYDDPKLTYTIDKPIENWDQKRREWLKLHPTFAAGASNRVLLLTGSQSSPCKSPIGDHLLLRCFKNKVDYCRIHGYDIYYNNAFLNPKMRSYWAKIPLVRAAMMAHPEVEWIMWMDSDAIFTDMEFEIPFERYRHHNLVVHGWSNLIYEKKQSWVAVNAGIFLIRNCQWSMDLLDAWAEMGPKSPDYKKWGQTLRSTFKDKMFPESDDQSALIYLMLKHKRKWGDKVYIENQYSLHGYWIGIVGKLDNMNDKYIEIEKSVHKLRRRHAEAVTLTYSKLRNQYINKKDNNNNNDKDNNERPFITHFTGCQPCSGDHNPAYAGDACWVGMKRALNFADNQVLKNYGFAHQDLNNSSTTPLPYDYPGEDFEELV